MIFIIAAWYCFCLCCSSCWSCLSMSGTACASSSSAALLASLFHMVFPIVCSVVVLSNLMGTPFEHRIKSTHTFAPNVFWLLLNRLAIARQETKSTLDMCRPIVSHRLNSWFRNRFQWRVPGSACAVCVQWHCSAIMHRLASLYRNEATPQGIEQARI